MDYVLRFPIYNCQIHIVKYFKNAIQNNTFQENDKDFLLKMNEFNEMLNLNQGKNNRITIPLKESEIPMKQTTKVIKKKSPKKTTKLPNLQVKPKRKVTKRQKKASPVVSSSSDESMVNDLEEEPVKTIQKKQDDFYNGKRKSSVEDSKNEMFKELLSCPKNNGFIDEGSDDSSNTEYSKEESEKIDDDESSFSETSDYT